ncbi:unnamed protein product [Urochloa humidicola]
MAKGSKVHELETDVPASELWEIYGTLGAATLIPELVPHVITKVDLISGDGDVGTILQLNFPPGIPGLVSYKEKFTTVDHERYIKVAEAIEGDILKLGFLSYLLRLEVIPKGPDSSVVRSTLEFETDDAHPDLGSKVSTAPLATIAEAFVKYVKEKNQATILIRKLGDIRTTLLNYRE